MDPNDWEKKTLATNDNYHIQIYNVEMGYIANYNHIRKEYVTVKFLKNYFYNKATPSKINLNYYSM
jgi:hypothetical protein